MFVKKGKSKLKYRFSLSTELSAVFDTLYCHRNCFTFYNGEVIRNFSPLEGPLEDGNEVEVVVKEVRHVVVRMDGREAKQYILSVHDMDQKFHELFSSDVELKESLDLDYCYLKYNSEEEPVLWSDPLSRWLWKEETIELITQVNVTVTFEERNVSDTYRLSDTMESVLWREFQKREGYFVYNDRKEVLLHSDTLRSITRTQSTVSLCLVVKSGLFITNIDSKKIDLTKYRTMQDFMKSFRLCEVWYNNTPVDSGQKMSEFVYHSFHVDCCLHVVVEPNIIQNTHFSIGIISQVAKNNPSQIVNNVDQQQSKIYSHWIAIAIYDSYGKKPNNVSDDTVNTVTDNIKKLLSSNFIKDDKILVEYESSFTAFLCQEFQRCFGYEVVCLHQAIIKHPPNHCKPDLYFVSNKLRPLLVGDFKSDNYECAKVETFGYCMAIANENSGIPFIAMPCSERQFVMYVCFSETTPLFTKSSLIPIKLFEANPQDSNEMKQFIKCLMFGIDMISKYPVKPFEVEPRIGLILTIPLNRSKRVYKSNNTVYKLYDKRELHDKEGQRIDLDISYLQPHREDLSLDGRFYMLSYRFIEQKPRQLRSYKDYMEIIKTLNKLHSCNYVHSDVRECNLLFPQETEAMLIDFDLMDIAGTPYPDGFNKLCERHPDAKPGYARKIIHDRHALVCIMEKELFYNCLGEEEKKQLQLYKTSEHAVSLIFH